VRTPRPPPGARPLDIDEDRWIKRVGDRQSGCRSAWRLRARSGCFVGERLNTTSDEFRGSRLTKCVVCTSGLACMVAGFQSSIHFRLGFTPRRHITAAHKTLPYTESIVTDIIIVNNNKKLDGPIADTICGPPSSFEIAPIR